MPRGAAMVVVCAAVLCGSRAAAQIPADEPPGPYVVDIRGATSTIPTASAFYPAFRVETTVPARGFGGEGGVHVYVASLGPARLGLGASFVQVRGTASGVSSTTRLMAPQLSFNFGTSRGWSSLSAGIGAGHVASSGAAGVPPSRDSGLLRSVNAGGGARWFLNARVGVGFDVRFHHLAARESRGTPATTMVAVAVGLSVK